MPLLGNLSRRRRVTYVILLLMTVASAVLGKVGLVSVLEGATGAGVGAVMILLAALSENANAGRLRQVELDLRRYAQRRRRQRSRRVKGS